MPLDTVQLFVQLLTAIVGGNRLDADLSGLGFLIRSDQRLLQIVARKVAWCLVAYSRWYDLYLLCTLRYALLFSVTLGLRKTVWIDVNFLVQFIIYYTIHNNIINIYTIIIINIIIIVNELLINIYYTQ